MTTKWFLLLFISFVNSLVINDTTNAVNAVDYISKYLIKFIQFSGNDAAFVKNSLSSESDNWTLDDIMTNVLTEKTLKNSIIVNTKKTLLKRRFINIRNSAVIIVFCDELLSNVS